MRIMGMICAAGTLVATASVGHGEERRTQVVDRMEAAADVLQGVIATPDKSIPQQILQDAKCIVVIPGFSKGAFIVGGSGGKGVATCRTATSWSAPAPIEAGGASIGLQAGGSRSDVVLLLMNDRAKNDLMAGKFKGGGDVSVEAGPVGAHANVKTAAQNAAVYSYARTKGLFAGVSYAGVKMGEDSSATTALYGRPTPISDILEGRANMPGGVEHFMELVKERIGHATHATR